MLLRGENLDLQSVITPVKVDVLVRMFEKSGYDKDKTKALHKGFTEGFDLNYQGLTNRQSESEKPTLDGG